MELKTLKSAGAGKTFSATGRCMYLKGRIVVQQSAQGKCPLAQAVRVLLL